MLTLLLGILIGFMAAVVTNWIFDLLDNNFK